MRQRTLKPGFFKNEDLAELTPIERLLFAGLFLVADRSGRFEDRPGRIKAEVLPYEDGISCDSMLSRLEAKGFIQRYEVDGKRYGLIPKFELHQHPHPKEPPSVIPPPVKSNGQTRKGNGETLSGREGSMPRRAGSSFPSGSSIPSEISGAGRVVVSPSEPKEPDPVPTTAPPVSSSDGDFAIERGIRYRPDVIQHRNLVRDLIALVDRTADPSDSRKFEVIALETLQAIGATRNGKTIDSLDLRGISPQWAAVTSHAARKFALDQGFELPP